MVRPVTNPFLKLKREVVARDKWGKPLFKCKNWDCENLTTSHRCRECNSKSKRGLSWNSTPMSKRINKNMELI